MRLLGVDFGFRRIGLAVAETDPEIITARPSIEASGALKRDAQALAEIARSEAVDAAVIGLPIFEEEARMARICRTLAEHLVSLGVETHMVDESMTSLEAEARLRDRDDRLTAAKRRRLKDGEAARLILERFIHEQKIG